jgi:threonine dehydrogenase-like Zn-dependent dehydrogenase
MGHTVRMSNVGDGRRVAIAGAGPSGFYAAELLLAPYASPISLVPPAAARLPSA